MKEFLKKYIGILSFIGTLILTKIIAEISASVGPELLFKSNDDKIIAALLVAIFSHVLHISSEIDNNATSSEVETHVKRIVQLLKVHNEYFNDDWLFTAFENIASLMDLGKKNRNGLELAKNDLKVAIDQAKKTLVVGSIELNMDEWVRITKLRGAQELASECVYAVTIDVREYYKLFWMSVNEEEYSLFNIEAARKGAKIKRIFILEQDVFSNIKNEKHHHFKELISALKKGGEQIELSFISMENFKSKFPDVPDTSFFLSDDSVASESGTGDKSSGGYFAINKSETYDPLKLRFEQLSIIAKRI